MKICIKTYSNELDAKMAQGLLKSNGIDSVVTPGNGGAATMSVVSGLDYSYQLFIKDSDKKIASEILEIEE